MIQISEELFTANTQPTNTRGSGSLCTSANNNSYNPLCPVFHGRKWNQVLVSTKQRGNMGTDVGVYTRGLASEALNNTQYRLGVIQCACLQVFQILEVFKWQHILVELKDEHSEPKSRKNEMPYNLKYLGDMLAQVLECFWFALLGMFNMHP